MQEKKIRSEIFQFITTPYLYIKLRFLQHVSKKKVLQLIKKTDYCHFHSLMGYFTPNQPNQKLVHLVLYLKISTLCKLVVRYDQFNATHLSMQKFQFWCWFFSYLKLLDEQTNITSHKKDI